MFINGKNPVSFETCQFFVSVKYVRDLQAYSKSSDVIADMFNIEPVLQDPTSLFEGLNRTEFDDGYCYCGVPERKYKFGQTGAIIDLPFPPGFVFVVFVNIQPDGLTITGWENRKCDPNDPLRPNGWATDFRTERQLI
jgi:hypothetical protein